MAGISKRVLWLSVVYALSFACYLPMLLRRNGAAVPEPLLCLRYGFVRVPALISAVFLLRGHGVRIYWLDCFRRISPKEFLTWLVISLSGIFITCGYSLWNKTSLFSSVYPSVLSFVSSAAYLFLTALAEELAWRGFLLKCAAPGRGNTAAALLTGAFWAVWHLPMWMIRNSLSLEELLPLFFWTVLVSLVLGIAYFRFENLLSAALFHMTFNLCFLAPAAYNSGILLLGILLYLRKIQKSDQGVLT